MMMQNTAWNLVTRQQVPLRRWMRYSLDHVVPKLPDGEWELVPA
jgi:hypothetical protein